ncbi:MAG: aquaporin [Candidatus Thermoplasmatota archaeon]
MRPAFVPDLRPEAAEALGVFFLVLAGGAAILDGAGSLAVALAFGFAVAVLIYALGHVCGAHYNPAITIAFALTGHFPWRRVGPYLAAQLLGALAAAVLLDWVFDGVGPVTTTLRDGLGIPAAAAVEFLASFLLGLVIIGVATDKRASQGFAGIAIGLTVAVNSVWAGPLTGSSTNPARTLGPALVDLQGDALWLYLAMPVAGACAAMATYEWLRGARKPHPGETLGALGPIDLHSTGAQ